MAEELLTLRLEPHVESWLTLADPNSRRLLENWFEHLRRWPNDELIRTRSQKLKPDEELYAFQTAGSNLIFAFTIQGKEATVVSIFTKELLEQYRQAVGAGK